MQISLKDIINLDYLISRDNALDSKEDIRSRALKDRKIYNQCKGSSKNDRALLLSWLKLRKDEKGLPILPGTVFSSLYTCMVYIMILSGIIIGITTVYSFLAYHGARPVNVTSFTALFIVLQVIFMLVALFLLVRMRVKKNHSYEGSIVHKLVSSLFFNVLPKIIKKTGGLLFNQSIEDLDYFISFMRMKTREYRDLFFWPFFILTSLFAFSFSAGVLGGMFFRIVVSDMAFGWQSTLMASSHNVHDIVSFTALPWSWFVPEAIAVPSLEQIEGSRIILKEGIYSLTTQDLVSWWPFLCFGVVFYAVIPRGLLIITGSFFQQQALKNFNFSNPNFRQLIVRMKSPFLGFDTQESAVNQTIENDPVKSELKTDSFSSQQNLPDGKALLLVSKKVFCHETIETVVKGIEMNLLMDVKETIGINFDFEQDADTLTRIRKSDADQVILVHEVWQPPIRELLYYITKIKEALPGDIPLYVLLTMGADQEDLGVDRSDINFKVWEKSVFKLEDPGISVIRFLQS
ncbi:MAG: DUF2868 domain-containing protein [Thermodesulfobacteriota bacterium]